MKIITSKRNGLTVVVLLVYLVCVAIVAGMCSCIYISAKKKLKEIDTTLASQRTNAPPDDVAVWKFEVHRVSTNPATDHVTLEAAQSLLGRWETVADFPPGINDAGFESTNETMFFRQRIRNP